MWSPYLVICHSLVIRQDRSWLPSIPVVLLHPPLPLTENVSQGTCSQQAPGWNLHPNVHLQSILGMGPFFLVSFLDCSFPPALKCWGSPGATSVPLLSSCFKALTQEVHSPSGPTGQACQPLLQAQGGIGKTSPCPQAAQASSITARRKATLASVSSGVGAKGC